MGCKKCYANVKGGQGDESDLFGWLFRKTNYGLGF